MNFVLGEILTKEDTEENRRKNLKKYYKSVKTCSNCGNLYGSDMKKEISEWCPVCLGEVISQNTKISHKNDPKKLRGRFVDKETNYED